MSSWRAPGLKRMSSGAMPSTTTRQRRCVTAIVPDRQRLVRQGRRRRRQLVRQCKPRRRLFHRLIRREVEGDGRALLRQRRPSAGRRRRAASPVPGRCASRRSSSRSTVTPPRRNISASFRRPGEDAEAVVLAHQHVRHVAARLLGPFLLAGATGREADQVVGGGEDAHQARHQGFDDVGEFRRHDLRGALLLVAEGLAVVVGKRLAGAGRTACRPGSRRAACSSRRRRSSRSSSDSGGRLRSTGCGRPCVSAGCAGGTRRSALRAWCW